MNLPTAAQDNLTSSGWNSLEDYAEHWRDDIDEIASGWRYNAAQDEAVVHHLMNRCCSVPDSDAAGGILQARWPKSCSDDLRIFVAWHMWDTDDMHMPLEQAQIQFQRAMTDWMAAVDLRWTLTTTEREAHCKVHWEKLRGSTLAWSHLANGSCGLNAQQRYDKRRWTPHYFYLVVLHELGHLLGLPHIPGRHILNPSIVADLDGLTDKDIAKARELYGPAKKPDPKPDSVIQIPDSPVLVDGQRVGRLTFVSEVPNDPGSGWGNV